MKAKSSASELLKAAWAARAPLLWVQAPDTMEACDNIASELNALPERARPKATWTWSPVTGWVQGRQDPPSLNPVDALMEIASPTQRGLYIGNRLGEGLAADIPFAAALQHVRRTLAERGASLVCVVPFGSTPPASVASDLVSVSLPYPPETELIERANATIQAFSQSKAAKESTFQDWEGLLKKLSPLLRGLTRFGAEQVAAVAAAASSAIGQPDISAAMLAREQILAAANLRVVPVDPISLPGLDGLTGWLGKMPAQVVVWIDEIEKALAGYSTAGKGDSSGVTQDQMAVLLNAMQEYDMLGALLVGPPGTGKSEAAKQVGQRLSVPVVQLDLGSLKGSLVGESEQRIRRAISAITALGRALVIATSNGIESVPPELRRRFSLGTWFCDLPNAIDRVAVWEVWLKRCSLTSDPETLAANSEGWAGADIAAACKLASLTQESLTSVMQRITPVGVTAAELRARLQQSAHGRWLDARTGAIFRVDSPAVSRQF